jgi:CheY-like chemotaxis protein
MGLSPYYTQNPQPATFACCNEQASAEMPKNATILIAEDDENDRFLIQRAFEKAGTKLTVAFAGDGEQTIQLLKEARGGNGKRSEPMLLLLDVKMPRLDGFQVLQWLLENPANRPALIIVLTSSGDPKDIQRARALGANSYLIKPHDHSEYVKIAQDLTNQCAGSGNLARALAPYHRPSSPPASHLSS